MAGSALPAAAFGPNSPFSLFSLNKERPEKGRETPITQRLDFLGRQPSEEDYDAAPTPPSSQPKSNNSASKSTTSTSASPFAKSPEVLIKFALDLDPSIRETLFELLMDAAAQHIAWTPEQAAECAKCAESLALPDVRHAGSFQAVECWYRAKKPADAERLLETLAGATKEATEADLPRLVCLRLILSANLFEREPGVAIKQYEEATKFFSKINFGAPASPALAQFKSTKRRSAIRYAAAQVTEALYDDIPRATERLQRARHELAVLRIHSPTDSVFLLEVWADIVEALRNRSYASKVLNDSIQRLEKFPEGGEQWRLFAVFDLRCALLATTATFVERFPALPHSRNPAVLLRRATLSWLLASFATGDECSRWKSEAWEAYSDVVWAELGRLSVGHLPWERYAVQQASFAYAAIGAPFGTVSTPTVELPACIVEHRKRHPLAGCLPLPEPRECKRELPVVTEADVY